MNLSNFSQLFPGYFSPDQLARAQTIFLKKLSLLAHEFYQGKMQTLPKCSTPSIEWLNVWYTPGVSAISTSIRSNNDLSFLYSNRGNLVGVVSDSTRVLGDGDCTPPGGLGVMEGKAFLMKYLGSVDAVALCANTRDKNGKPDPDRLIEFVKMLEPSFGAINLEDISQPNCFKVLDVLRKECDIPVWHDDAQGTACVTLAGLLNALDLAGKKLSEAKIVMLGAGAANSTIARILLADGAKGENMIMFDVEGALCKERKDFETNKEYYRLWELCQKTNLKSVKNIEEAIKGADVLIALSKPGPDTVKKEWIKSMAPRAIVFVCANPIPEIWPHLAKEAGAYIVATGRGDFPNQVNNSVCFPGLLKGALLVRSKKISDSMAIRCAHSIADFAKKRGISSDNITAKMQESEVFAIQAADVAEQAVKEGFARVKLSWQEVYDRAHKDISETQKTIFELEKLLPKPKQKMLDEALAFAISEVSVVK